METSRRNFIKNSAILGAGILINPFNSFKVDEASGKFLDKIGVCTGISDNAILAAAGYSFIEEAVTRFLIPDEDESIYQTRLSLLKESKLPVEACNSFIAGNMKSVGPAAVHNDIIKFAEIAFRRAETAGVKTIVFGSGASRSIPESYSSDKAREQFITLCKRMVPLAEKYNVVISLEPLNTKECNFINSLSEGGEIVKVVNHKNFRLLADIYHMLRDHESPDNIIKYGDLLYHTHIAENVGRSAPGVNKEDFIPYFKALKDVGYKGRMSIECNWKNLEEQAGKAIQTIKSQLSAMENPG